MIEQMVPPGSGADHTTSSYFPTPVDIDRSFFMPETPGYDSLVSPIVDLSLDALQMRPNPSYAHYLKMHKVMVGQKGAQELEVIHNNLRHEKQPRYLSVAGSAAVEVALVQQQKSSKQRLALIDSARDCWRQAIETQRAFNAAGPEHMVEHSVPYRLALNLAMSSLLEDLVTGYVRRATCKSTFLDCLNVAQASLVQSHLLARDGDMAGAADHVGFGYEANALLAFNRYYAGTRFIIPAFDRADSGHYYGRQTHDLMMVEQSYGTIESATPIEVKSAAGVKDRQRYGALLVRGKMHLSAPNRWVPRYTLEAIAACYDKDANPEEEYIAHSVTGLFRDMVKDYKSGEPLADVVHSRNGTGFRDKTLVVQNYPGLVA